MIWNLDIRVSEEGGGRAGSCGAQIHGGSRHDSRYVIRYQILETGNDSNERYIMNYVYPSR